MERINVNFALFWDPWIQLLLIFALAVVFSSALELMESDSQRVFLTLCTSRIFCCFACVYLLGLLAMIKCSVCSYQCDN